MNKVQFQRQMQINKRGKGSINHSHLQLSAQVKDVLSAYHRKGTWKSKTGKMTKTLTGETLGKPNVMTEEDIDRLFEKSKEKNSKLNTEANIGSQTSDYTKLVKFLHIEDDFDKLLTGLADIENQQNKINTLFQARQLKGDLTAQFKKNYMVGKIIGQGAYASVRVAIHKPSNKKIAIKVYEKNKIKENQRKKAVRREIKIMQNLKHPNIVGILDVVQTNNHLNIAMQYLPGMSLGGYLKSQQNNRIAQKECKLIFRGLTEALVYMHARNIAHRDIKLENIILKEDLSPKFIDFGFSTCIESKKKIKIFCGTPSYMAPEVVQRKQYRGENADIWALGVLLFVSLTGIFPFKGSTDQELYNKINHANYPKMELMFSQSAMDLVAKMLTVCPQSRITAYQILMHPWFSQSNLNMSSTIKLNNKKSKEKSNDKRKRICTVSSINSNATKETKFTLKNSKKGLAQTCKENLQQQIRMAMKSPKNGEGLFSYRNVEKENHIRHRTRMETKPLQQIVSENRSDKMQLFGRNQTKVIDLLRVEMKKRTEISSKSKNNKRV